VTCCFLIHVNCISWQIRGDYVRRLKHHVMLRKPWLWTQCFYFSVSNYNEFCEEDHQCVTANNKCVVPKCTCKTGYRWEVSECVNCQGRSVRGTKKSDRRNMCRETIFCTVTQEYATINQRSSSSSSSSCSWRVRCVPCSLILKVELVPPSFLRSSNVPSSFWSVFQCLSWQSISVHPLYVL
jgi:hypothetical protein